MREQIRELTKKKVFGKSQNSVKGIENSTDSYS
jgi:hypothetical protein